MYLSVNAAEHIQQILPNNLSSHDHQGHSYHMARGLEPPFAFRALLGPVKLD